MKSWKTTLAGVIAFFNTTAIQLALLFDGNDMTNPDWNIVITGIVVLFGLGAARDNSVTSEEAKAK